MTVVILRKLILIITLILNLSRRLNPKDTLLPRSVCLSMHINVTSIFSFVEPVTPYINSSEKDIVSFDMVHPVGKTVGGSLKCLVGASIWLECPMGGFPPPEIKWAKDNLPIFSGKRIKVSRKRIKVLGTIMSDTGWYSCSVSNGVGTVTRATFVHLIGKILRYGKFRLIGLNHFVIYLHIYKT